MRRRYLFCPFVLFPLGVLGACNALIGIDDLPPVALDGAVERDATRTGTGENDATSSLDAPNDDDASLGDDEGQDSGEDGNAGPIPGCDSGTGTAIGDAGSVDGNARSCGPCRTICGTPSDAFTATCVDGLCGYVGPASGLPDLRETASFSLTPVGQLAIDEASRVYVGQAAAGTMGYWVSLDGTSTSVPGVGGLPSVYLSDAGDPAAVVVGGPGPSLDYATVDGGTIVSTCAYGTSDVSASVRPQNQTIYTFNASGDLLSYPFSTSTCGNATGARTASDDTSQSPLYISTTGLAYSLYGTELTTWSTETNKRNTTTSVPKTSFVGGTPGGAVNDDGTLIYSVRSDAGATAGVGLGNATAQPWSNVDVAAPNDPVITANGVAILPDSQLGLIAVDIEKATVVWSGPRGAHPEAALVADDGLIWAFANGSSGGEIFGVDTATGNVRFDFTGLDPIADLLLEKGKLIAQSKTSGHLFLLTVSSHGYDLGSPWPVKGHDNQRTYNAASPLTY